MDMAIHKFGAGNRMYQVMQDEGGGIRLLLCELPCGFWESIGPLRPPGSDSRSDVVRELAALAATAARDRADCDTARATRDAAIGRALAAERELAARADRVPDGSRTFETAAAKWKISFTSGGYAQLFRIEDARNFGVALYDKGAPHFQILAREFAALGREQGFAHKIDSLESLAGELNAARERIAELEARPADRINLPGSFPFSRAVTVRGLPYTIGFSETERLPILNPGESGRGIDVSALNQAEVLADLMPHFTELAREQGEWSQLAYAKSLVRRLEEERSESADRIAALEQQELDSRAEVADLLARLEEQKARADLSEHAVLSLSRCIAEINDERNSFRDRAVLAEQRLADFEARQVEAFENLATGCIAAVQARTEGALCAVMCDRPDMRPEAVVFTRRGETVYALSLGETEWSALPPLPPVEPETKVGAEECESEERREPYRFAYEPGIGRGTAFFERDGSRYMAAVDKVGAASLFTQDGGVEWTPVRFFASGLSTEDLVSIFVSLGRDVARAAARLAAPREPELDPPSFAADAPASALPDDLREALRQVVSDYGARIPAPGEPVCEKCGFWAADSGDLCGKCFASLEAERGA